MSQLTIDQALQIARKHHGEGQFNQAENLYRQILQAQPEHADTLRQFGLLAHQTGRQEVAVELLGRAVALKPGDFEAWGTLGNALQALGHFDAAIAADRRAIALNPHHPAIYNNLGIALRNKGQLAGAIAIFGQALALNPNLAEIHCNLGVALQAQGNVDAAIAAYRRAIELNPHYAQAHCNLGVALRHGGELDAAIAAYEQTIALDPTLAAAYSNLGNDLKARGELDAAIEAYRRAIALRPDYHEAHSNLLLALNYHPASTTQSLHEEARIWAARYAEPLNRVIPGHANERSRERRLRIGYLSGDFREHASAFFLVPLLEGHGKQVVEVFCYAHLAREDALTQRMRACSDHWQNIMGMGDDAVADLIRRDQIDILVDLKLHTENNRALVFARKPAPVQATWLGYPGGMGMGAMDYRLSDPYLDPPERPESDYTEKTIRLPETFWCYDPLDGREIPCNALPALSNGWVTFGCLNNFCKINDAVLRMWAGILDAVARSHLLLLAPMGAARFRVRKLMEQQGIDPGRLEFVPPQSRREYLQTYHRIDLSLDSFPCGGHTTSMDGLWMGVPVVSLAGQTAVCRSGVSILSNIGLAELVVGSPEAYVAAALGLARDLPRLNHLRSTLRQRMERSPLMDGARFARHMEAAYRQMWREWCATDAKNVRE